MNILENLVLQTQISIDVGPWWPVFPIGGLIGFIIYMLAHPEKVDAWAALFSRLFSSISKRAERRSVASDIQARLLSFIKNFQLKDVLPYGLRFKWVTDSNFESYVEEGDVIVVMDNHKNNARNFVNAIIAYTNQGFLPNVRMYLPEDVLNAAELLMQEKIIRKERPDALKIFRDDVLHQRLQNNKEIKKYKNRLTGLDEVGLFDNIFLVEINHSAHRLQERDKFEGKNNIDGFIALLEYLATRKPGDEIGPLNYPGRVFRVWIVLVAKLETIVWGTDPYTNRVNEAITKHFDSVYILARKQNLKYIEPLIEAIKKNTTARFQWKHVFQGRDYRGNRIEVVVCLFRI